MNNKKTRQLTNLEESWPCPVFANYTLEFALQLREKHGKTSVRVGKEVRVAKDADMNILAKEKFHNRALVKCMTKRRVP
jgi:hypothetical protein